MAEVFRHGVDQLTFIAKNDFFKQFEVADSLLFAGVGIGPVGSLLAIEHILQSSTDQL